MKKLLLADDHHLFREGVSSFFEGEGDVQLVGQASNGHQVLDFLIKNEVDVLLMDISMPVLDGIEASQRVKAKYPDVKIIMLTMHDTQNYIRKMLEIGVDGYLLKTTTKEEVLECIRVVISGKTFYGKDVQQVFMDSYNSDKVVTSVKLTKREKEILNLICDELSTNDIAGKLFLSTHTVETHRKNLLNKTGSKNVAGLVKFALQNKFI